VYTHPYAVSTCKIKLFPNYFSLDDDDDDDDDDEIAYFTMH